MSQHDFNKYYIDENVVRINAAGTVIVATATLIMQLPWLAIILAADFGIRAFTNWPSPLSILSKFIVRSGQLQPRPIFAPPKKFAAALGAIFSILIALALFLEINEAAYTIGVLLLICAVLESVFRICLGCYIYNWVLAPLSQDKQS